MGTCSFMSLAFLGTVATFDQYMEDKLLTIAL